MEIVIDRYEDFDVEVAKKTIGHHFDSEITDVKITGLGEGVGLMSSIARGHLTFSSGEQRKVVVKCTARTENSELSKGLNFYKNEVNFYLHLANDCPIEVPKWLDRERAVRPYSSTNTFLPRVAIPTWRPQQRENM